MNVIADDKVLDDAGKIDAGKLHAFTFDQIQKGYYAVGEKAGWAWYNGAGLMKNERSMKNCYLKTTDSDE